MDETTTNGLRWYFLEAYKSGKVFNAKQFAELTHICRATMLRYLKGIGPRQESVLRDIERALGKPEFDMHIPRRILDWKRLEPLLYSNKPSLRKKYSVPSQSAFAREDIIKTKDENPIINQLREEIHRLNLKMSRLQDENRILHDENRMLQDVVNLLQYEV